MTFDSFSNERENAGKLDQPAEFCLVPLLAPAWMIAILFPASNVPPSGLQMPVFLPANPNLTPGGRNREPFYSAQHRRIIHFAAIGSNVPEGSSPLDSTDPRLIF